MIPNGLKYSKSHEWVKVEGGIATVGITHHAQAELGDITFADLPKVGASVAVEGNAGSVESVKAASDIYSPVSGTITEVNAALNGAPELINQDPYGAGWMFKLGNLKAAELDALMDAAAYAAFTSHA
jgi:glycine cleavage system H protein